MPQPPDRFFADPFLFAWGGETYLFLEVFPYDKNKGEIAFAKLDAR